ncbi:MAG TPA: NAD(P)H-binding protein [Chloroflexota bacterium]|nr:NAD(P)H-binding protein [Chloroflexota bacterium]
MKVLVVGASGMLGRALVPLLVGAGHTVRALSRHPVGPSLGVDPVAGDLLRTDLTPVVEGCEAVVHAATAIPRDPSLPGAWDLNTRLRTLGTRRLVGAAQAAGVRRYVQQSIIMAYADGGDAWLDETAPFDASPARAATVEPVREMESIVRGSTLDWCILRGGQFAGPGTAQDFVVESLASGTATVPCDGAYFISPIHPADMATAAAAALAVGAPSRTIFNVVGDPLTYATYVDHLATLRGLPPPRHDESAPCPPSHRCTAAAAHTALSWHPTHSIWPKPR